MPQRKFKITIDRWPIVYIGISYIQMLYNTVPTYEEEIGNNNIIIYYYYNIPM